MKKLYAHIIFWLIPFLSYAQITTPIQRAGFGVEADLRANYFQSIVQSGNDDWFKRDSSVSRSGDYVIDTTGAAAIVSGYSTNPNTVFNSFSRGMRYPMLSTISNRILYDAIYYRDYHGVDSTSFTGGSKNGQSPGAWSGAISPVLSKNDIVDCYLHVRRDGINTTDSLWFFGAVGIAGTNGDRYFDFEMYQTDIAYNRSSRKFEGYGPDFGHTSWGFDAVGDINHLGDIIFTAEYGNAGLQYIEARLWVKKTIWQSTTPNAFDWTGTFDGDGSNATYGYAGIKPKAAGAFYQGLQNSDTTWSGPFGTIKTNDTYSSTYDAIQFMEFSVNLTKLGLDPMNFTYGNVCNLSFSRVLVKTRTSTSFTASITDFVSPFAFRSIPDVQAAATTPLFCYEQNMSDVLVINPLATATYTWTTPNGHILHDYGTRIVVDSPGIYIVKQQLLTGCQNDTYDTIVVIRAQNNSCVPLSSKLLRFNGTYQNGVTRIDWRLSGNADIARMDIQKTDLYGHYQTISTVYPLTNAGDAVSYSITDTRGLNPTGITLYRLSVTEKNGLVYYSPVVGFRPDAEQIPSLKIYPNPVHGGTVMLEMKAAGDVLISNQAGQLMLRTHLEAGIRSVDISRFPAGMYLVSCGSLHSKLIVQ